MLRARGVGAFLAAMAIVLGLGRPCPALISNLRTSPGSVIVGNGFTGIVDDDGQNPITDLKWEFQFDSGRSQGPWTTWDDGTNNPSPAVYCAYPGTYNIRVTATYGPGDDGGCSPPPTVLTGQVLTSTADGFTITGGLNTPVDNGSGVLIQYQVTSGGLNAGPYLGGTAQERITNKRDWKGNNPPDDAQWSPPAPYSGFYMAGSVIYDTKALGLAPGDWNQIGVGQAFYWFTQNNRIVWLDPANNVMIESLGSVNLLRRKVSATTWQVEQQ